MKSPDASQRLTPELTRRSVRKSYSVGRRFRDVAADRAFDGDQPSRARLSHACPPGRRVGSWRSHSVMASPLNSIHGRRLAPSTIFRTCWCWRYTASSALTVTNLKMVERLSYSLNHAVDETAIARERIVDAGDVLPRLVEAHLAGGRDPATRDLRRHREVEDEIRPQQRRVALEEPIELEAARGVARERGEQVAIGEHRLASPERRQDLGLDAVAEIDRVEQRVFERRQRADLLADADERLDQRRRRPPRRDDGLAAALQPGAQQLALRRLARAVGAFKGDEQAARAIAPLDHLLDGGAFGFQWQLSEPESAVAPVASTNAHW